MTTPAKRTIKVPPVLYRQGTSELKEDGSIRLSISSDKPYLRYDWWNDEEYYEKLDHSQGGVDLERIRAGTALLFNHKRDVQLGTITEPELTNGKCFVAARVSEAEDVASHRTRIKEGILKDSSVGYELIDDGEEEGEIDGIPVFRFRWRPFEASLVTIPADITVGVGRERDLEKPAGEPREILIREKTLNSEKKRIDTNSNPSQKRETNIETRNNTMTPEEQAAADEKARKQRERDEADAARESKEKIQEGIKAARARETEIRAIAKKSGKVPDKVLEKAIEDAVEDENAVDSFRKLVFEKYWGNAEEVIETPHRRQQWRCGSSHRSRSQIEHRRTVRPLRTISEGFKATRTGRADSLDGVGYFGSWHSRQSRDGSTSRVHIL
jgi:phage head maturation protease